jgi:hypothetical protein
MSPQFAENDPEGVAFEYEVIEPQHPGIQRWQHNERNGLFRLGVILGRIGRMQRQQ